MDYVISNQESGMIALVSKIEDGPFTVIIPNKPERGQYEWANYQSHAEALDRALAAVGIEPPARGAGK